MTLNAIRNVFLGVFLSASFFISAQENHSESHEEKKFDPKEMIMHHIKDAYGFHIIDINDHAISIPLPVILWTENGLTTFMSSEFHHDSEGKVVVEKNGGKFVNYHEKVYQLNAGETALIVGEDHYPVNAQKPWDISITKNVFMMWVSMIVLLLIFIGAARKYKKSENFIPRGIASFVEPLVLFVRDEIAIPMIGEKKYARFMPYLLTIFFFIWLNNIFGLIPILNGANLSGNIAFTMTLAVFTFLITNLNGNKHYWSHILWMPGVPAPIKVLILTPVEIIGVFTKPISLMIRLFANITAGHIIILALLSLIFIFKSIVLAPVSVAFALFISVIEIIVTAIQAFIFTILSAQYIGMAVEEHEHH